MKKYIKNSLLLSICFCSCNYFQTKENNSDYSVRVGDNYLYKNEIEEILPKNYTLEDSLNVATTFVNNWALKQLLLQRAEENLPDEKKKEFEKLVLQYKTDLYTQSYLEMLVAKQIDTVIRLPEQEQFYEENKSIFVLNEELLKFRYIQLNEKEQNYGKIVEHLKKFSGEDKQKLEEEYANKYNSAFFNDKVWVKTSDIYSKLPFLRGKLNKKSINQFIEQKDSTGIYLVKIVDYLEVNEFAPMDYVKPTLRQIILSKRKTNYVNKLEKEIIENAIKKKQLEFYE